MAHIALPNDRPGIIAGLTFRTDTAGPLRELAQMLLHAPGALSPGERELIAAYVSYRNESYFCSRSHAAAAASHLGSDALVTAVLHNFFDAGISKKLQALLVIAGKVQQSGRSLPPRLVDTAREAGATDLEIHDTILVAAAFSMYNRYVDGLDCWQPDDPGLYAQMGQQVAEHGYLKSWR